ncbi:FixH family protein [Alkalicoccus urumqiensis]|uniref:YtkA-like domain-containing protein n=1 Tax=Alkalicoccus urumqiensis TaxID=1548213 RepID=A0A2P6MLL4_ALKUR|nr:FixH family protein [Alkalicoccus urumqiensis]PRO67167.1 hypothetical protein C6I21_01000 [Alkalicoccus urumqiensis]
MKKGLVMAPVLLLAACGTSDEESTGAVSIEDVNMEPLETVIEAPDSVEPGDDVVLAAVVTQGEEQVEDAGEVEFEIWVDGAKSESDSVEAVHTENGVYEAEYAFEDEAVYQVQAHTTARGSHVMPVQEVTSGDPDAEPHEGHHGEHAEVMDGFHVDWETDEAAVEEEVTLSFRISLDGENWSGDTRLEMGPADAEERVWIGAVEISDGQYEVQHAFSEAGTYDVVVHAEDEDIHEHVHVEVEVTE